MDLLPRWFQDGYTMHSSLYMGEKLRMRGDPHHAHGGRTIFFINVYLIYC
jgi:hypothetical protein